MTLHETKKYEIYSNIQLLKSQKKFGFFSFTLPRVSVAQKIFGAHQ